MNIFITSFGNADGNEDIHAICEELDFSKLIVIPYYRGLSERISNLLRNHGIKVVFKRGNTISNMLTCKPLVNHHDKYNIVYNIDCNDCTYVYIGHLLACGSEQ